VESSEPIRIFVMGPYTRGDVARNVARAIEAADELFGLGYYPYVPHLSHFWHLHRQRPYLDWMRLDRVWLLQCNAALRLPGGSPGADEEEGECRRRAIPVFRTIAELRKAMPTPK
jgi:hypothetical protein